MPIRACVFDAYGTLFDVSAAARRAAAEPGFERLGEVWPRLAADWRTKQLEYSWLRAVTGEHKDFWQVTCDGLDWALEAHGLDGDSALRERLLGLYRELDAYDEVQGVLARLREAGLETAILSNGSPDMLVDAITSAGLTGMLDHVLSVEEVGILKPARAVYELVPAHLGLPAREVLFVSSNGWDADAAGGFGFVTAWVNRAGQPPERLGHPPTHVLSDLSGIPALAGAA